MYQFYEQNLNDLILLYISVYFTSVHECAVSLICVLKICYVFIDELTNIELLKYNFQESLLNFM